MELVKRVKTPACTISKLIEYSSVCKIMRYNRVNWGPVMEPLSGMPTDETGACCFGTNVFLCTDDGQKVAFHEFVIKKFTRVFEKVNKSTTEMDGLRDPMGNLVFIISGVDFSVLKGLSELLYTGVTTNLDCEKSKKDLLDILSFELELSTLVGEDADHDVIADVQEDPQNQDVFGTYLDLNCPVADKEDSGNKKLSEQKGSRGEVVNKSHQTITEHMDADFTSELEVLYEEVIEEFEMTEPEEPIRLKESGEPNSDPPLREPGERKERNGGQPLKEQGELNSDPLQKPEQRNDQKPQEPGKLQSNLLYQVSPSVPVPTVDPSDPSVFEKGKTFDSFEDFQTKWDAYYKETHNKYQIYSRHKTPAPDEQFHNSIFHTKTKGKFPYKDLHYRCVHFGTASASKGRGLRVHQTRNACNCKAEVKLLYLKQKQCYEVRHFHKDHINHKTFDKYEFTCKECDKIYKSSTALKFHLKNDIKHRILKNTLKY